MAGFMGGKQLGFGDYERGAGTLNNAIDESLFAQRGRALCIRMYLFPWPRSEFAPVKAYAWQS